MKQFKKLSRLKKEQLGKLQTKTLKQESWGEQYGLRSIHLTQSQQELKNKILNNDLVFVEGCAGSGKSLSVLYTFAQEYLKDNSKKIIYIRTPVEAGLDKIGALPDSLEAKTEPHFASAKELLSKLLSKGKVETDLGHRIEFKVPNYCLGCTFDNSLILIDEAQQLPALILKLLLERTGKHSKVVVAGDSTQLYTSSKNRNALLDAIPRFFTKDYYPRYDNLTYHKFSVDDVMRSDIVKTVIKAYSNDLPTI